MEHAKAKVATFQCDVSKDDDIRQAVAGVMKEFGKVDILINNAGTSRAMTFDKITDEIWQEDLDLKLFGAIRLTRLVWPGMQERKWGRITAFTASPVWPIVNSPPASERTAYVVGLFGSGRQYVCGLVRQNLGERAQYFRDAIRLHVGPTPMIYSGHATLKYVSRAQHLPAVTSRVLDAVNARYADLIFVYRHPLDSLLTNWVWWRTYIRESKCIAGISQVYRSTGDLCADLERNFADFQSFAAGDPAFFAAVRGPRFLSFAEFVEETELYLASAATLTLRLENFSIDPQKEFSKILEVMAADVDLNGFRVDSPRSKPYGYRVVQDQSPGSEVLSTTLRAGTKRRIERLGYEL